MISYTLRNATSCVVKWRIMSSSEDVYKRQVQVRLENLVHVGRDRHVATTDDTGDLADTLVIRRT